MDFTITKINEEIFPAVLAMQNGWVSENICYGLAPDTEAQAKSYITPYGFAALGDGEPCGFITAEKVSGSRFCIFPDGENYLEITNLYVKSDLRGRGIGAALLAETEKAARANGLINIYLSSAARGSEEIRRFYQKNGYRIWTTCFYKRSGTQTRTYEAGYLKYYRFVVIFARYEGKWLYCRRRDRDTWETPGGHIEPGETAIEAARRELWEETGAKEFDISPAFDYSVHTENSFSNGQAFLAQIKKLGPLPPFEMAEIKAEDAYPQKLTYPDILPVLYERLTKGGSAGDKIKPLTESRRGEVNAFIEREWGSTDMLIRDEKYDLTQADGFIYSDSESGSIDGLITYVILGDRCEITSLNSKIENRGVGTALIGKVKAAAASAGCAYLSLATTNDNINALRFYQRLGFDICGISLGAIDRERKIKPRIPLIGQNGIPPRHEISLELKL